MGWWWDAVAINHTIDFIFETSYTRETDQIEEIISSPYLSNIGKDGPSLGKNNTYHSFMFLTFTVLRIH